MLHDLYPREETAENEEIIATRLGSRYYHDKAGTDEGRADEGALVTQFLYPAAAWGPFSSLYYFFHCYNAL